MLAVAPSKAGKTTFLVSQLLGAFPCQKYGAVVSDPSNLHVIACDSGALTGVKEFLEVVCGVPKEVFPQIKVYNFQEDIRKAFASTLDYDGTLLSELLRTRDTIAGRCSPGKTSVMLMSSLTGIAQALERGVMGGPFYNDKHPKAGQAKKGYGDISKWTQFASWVQEIQNQFQVDEYHCIWEGHIYVPPSKPQDSKKQDDLMDDEKRESIRIRGSAGQDFPVNVEQPYLLERTGKRINEKGCEEVVIHTKHSAFGTQMQSRLATTNLEPKEYDLTSVFHRLGLKVGRWSWKTKGSSDDKAGSSGSQSEAK